MSDRKLITGRSEDERWHQRKDGSRFWGSGLMMPLQTGNGFVRIMRDRTSSHAKELELKESEARFRAGVRHRGLRKGHSLYATADPIGGLIYFVRRAGF